MALTRKQEEAQALRAEGLTQRQIADRLGISRRSVRERLDATGIDPAVQEAMDAFGLDIEPSMVWLKNKKFSAQVQPKKQSPVEYLQRVKEAFSNLPMAPAIPEPIVSLDDTMVVYPLFDVHLGLRAHAEVSGDEMDLAMGAERVKLAMAKVMATTPNAYRGLIINGGDFTHQTDDRNMTRKSGHVLDVAARNFPTVLEAVEVISACIEMALTKHTVVEYYSVPGNHDPQNWETILLALRERYRSHNRVTVVFHQREYSVVEHGEVALFIHHGDKRPPKDMAMFCAAECPEVWGRTKYRVLMTGHLHHLKADEFPGIYWLQLPALTVRDHYASGAFKSHPLIMALSFDRLSETARNTVRV